MREPRTLLPLSRLALAFFLAAPALSAQQQTAGQQQPRPPVPAPDLSSTVVVTANRNPESLSKTPSSLLVITGEELEALGARTLADALEFLPGIQVAHGADEGSLTSSVALWGLREFDAYSVLLDGVPAGGVYNPNTAFLPVEDIDRIEIQKGPNAVLYGQTAFAGVIQIFTRLSTPGGRGYFAAGGGSLTSGDAAFAYSGASGRNLFHLSALARGSHGWQDRAGYREEHLELSYARQLSKGQLRLSGRLLDRTQGFGSPFPRQGAEVAEEFDIHDNFAPDDARIADRAGMFTFSLQRPINDELTFLELFSVGLNRQTRIRGFLSEMEEGEGGGDEEGMMAEAKGSALRPRQLDFFQDAHVEWRRNWNGRQSLLQFGGSYQYGRLEAESHLFEYEVSLDDPRPPSSESLPFEEAEFFNRRDFAGFYLHEQFDVNSRLSLFGGVRLDLTRERQEIHAEGEEFEEGGGPGEEGEEFELEDKETQSAASYRAAAVFHLAPGSAAAHADAFVSLNHAFKPAAVNFAEPEAARPILEPEEADALEGGLRVGALDGHLFLQASAFQMRFTNLVVSEVCNGQVVLLNAGKQRFRGLEVSGKVRPFFNLPLNLSASYSLHRPVFTSFRTLNEEGEELVLDGKTLELAPKHLATFQIEYGRSQGLGFYALVGGAGSRPVNRRNTAIADGYLVVDAGCWYGHGQYRLEVHADNLTDSRHIVAESELADAQVYLHPPRRVFGELRITF